MVDTIRRRGRITRAELQERWAASGLSDGTPMCRRTIYNYREAIENLFGIKIECDRKTYEYYIDSGQGVGTAAGSMADWLLNAQAVNDALADARDISDRIFVEDVPSAREHLATIIGAIRQNRRITFDYHNYARSRPTRGVALEPYVLRIHRQRWYVVGRNVHDNRLKTYALDRMRTVTHAAQTFGMPAGFTAEQYFKDAFGIVVTGTKPRRVALRADHRNAHYLRDLPLHPSQTEAVHDGFSIFYYNMRITDDLVTELLSYGPRLTVIEPPELRTMMTTALRTALDAYAPVPAQDKPK